MIKKKVIVSSLLLASVLYGETLTLKGGWELIGADYDMTTAKFDNTCVEYMWKYGEVENKKDWMLHIANQTSYNYTGNTFNTLSKREGYWVKSSGDGCTISLSDMPTPVTTTTSENTVTLKSTSYDSSNKLQSTRETTYTLDDSKRVTQKNSVYKYYNTYSSSSCGEIQSTDIVQTTYQYDSKNNIVSSTLTQNGSSNYASTESFLYDSANNMISATSISTRYYDSNNDGVTEKHQYTSENTYTYDNNNNRIASTYNSEEKYDSNGDGSLDKTNTPHSSTSTMAYDSANNIISSTYVSTSSYDSNNDGVDEAHKSTGTQTMTYNSHNNSIARTYVSTSSYDSNGDGTFDKINSTYNSSDAITYVYDSSFNILSSVSISTTIDNYDSNGDGIKEEHIRKSKNAFAYTYDTNNNITSSQTQYSSGLDTNGDNVDDTSTTSNGSRIAYETTGLPANISAIKEMSKKSSYYSEYAMYGAGMNSLEMFW